MTSWTDWKEVPGGAQTEVAPAAVVFNNKLYMFVKARGSNDKKIYMTSSDDGEKWSEPAEMKANDKSGPATDMSPAATVLGNTLYLFVNGLNENNKTTYVSSTTDGTKWTEWKAVSGPKTTLAPTAVAFKGKLCVFVKGDDNKIHCAKEA